MKLNFNFPISDLDGNEIPESNLGKTIANVLVSARDGDALKLWDIALKLQKGTELDLDTSDTQMLKDRIKNADSITILVKAQALQVFQE